MADISKIKLPSGSTYNIKDATARDAISKLNSFEYVVSTTAATTPKDIAWTDSSSNSITGTLTAASTTMHKIYLVPSTNGTNDVYDEYITVNTTETTYAWELFGNTDAHLSDLGALAKKDSASASYKPAGTVSKPTFTGTKATISVSGTPAGTISTGTGTANYTPAGTISGGSLGCEYQTEATKFVAASATGGGSVTAGTAASCTLPSLSMTVSSETLTMSWTAGSFSANTPTDVTLPSFESTTYMTKIDDVFTVTQPTFKGTGAQLTFTGSSTTSTGSYTPAGSVSQPTFTGTSATITVS